MEQEKLIDMIKVNTDDLIARIDRSEKKIRRLELYFKDLHDDLIEVEKIFTDHLKPKSKPIKWFVCKILRRSYYDSEQRIIAKVSRKIDKLYAEEE